MGEPRSNQYECNVERKCAQLREHHVAPLTEFVRRLRCEHPERFVPWFDPDEAGVCARILILLEAPGRKAMREHGGSGFVSSDNDDQTAENMWRLLRDAEVERTREVVTWNAVPWYLGDGQRIAAAQSRDLEESRQALRDLLDLLPRVRVVVLLGKKTAKAWTDARVARELHMFEGAPHPSHLGLHGQGADKAPERREEIRQDLIEARRLGKLT